MALAKAGADVAIAEIDAPSGEATASAVRALGRRALSISCDVRSRQACEATVAAAIDGLGALHILVNNAIQVRPGVSFMDHVDDDMVMTWESGVMATFWCMQAAQPHLVAVGGGSIINFGSGAGTEGLAGFAGYAAAKEGIRALTRVAAREWGPVGIRVNAICPLANSEGMLGWGEFDPDGFRAALDRVPLGRIGDCEADIGRVVVFLASDDAAYLTAHTFMVDGGSGAFR
jgi:NAD(P)-dependent dehydrogenase (short-subunit alcohol dehydrogenase family)